MSVSAWGEVPGIGLPAPGHRLTVDEALFHPLYELADCVRCGEPADGFSTLRCTDEEHAAAASRWYYDCADCRRVVKRSVAAGAHTPCHQVPPQIICLLLGDDVPPGPA